MKALPATRWQYVEHKQARVNIDYHVELEGRLYSAPYTLVRELLDLRFTASVGCQHITLIGGEPTLYPGWHEVGRRLVELGALVNMISNGLTWSHPLPGIRDLRRP